MPPSPGTSVAGANMLPACITRLTKLKDLRLAGDWRRPKVCFEVTMYMLHAQVDSVSASRAGCSPCWSAAQATDATGSIHVTALANSLGQRNLASHYRWCCRRALRGCQRCRSLRWRRCTWAARPARRRASRRRRSRPRARLSTWQCRTALATSASAPAWTVCAHCESNAIVLRSRRRFCTLQ